MKKVRRNPVARSPLLVKGGVHQRSQRQQRHADKSELQDSIADWQWQSREPDPGAADSTFISLSRLYCPPSF